MHKSRPAGRIRQELTKALTANNKNVTSKETQAKAEQGIIKGDGYICRGGKWEIMPECGISKYLADTINRQMADALKEIDGSFNPRTDTADVPKIYDVKNGKDDAHFETLKDLQKDYETICAREPSISKDLCGIVKDLDGRLIGFPYRLKGAGSLERKIKSRVESDDISPQKAISEMGDIIRYTALSPTHDALGETANKIIEGMKKAGYHIVEVDNKWLKPKGGYRGLHLAVVTPDWKQQFELQIHSKKSMEIKQRQHPIYEVTRTMKNDDKRKDVLTNIMMAMGDSLPMPKGIEKIISKKNKNWMVDHKEVI